MLMEESMDFSSFPVWLKPLSNQCKNVKEESVQISPKGTGHFVDPHINRYKQVALFMME